MFSLQPTPYDLSFRLFGFPIRVQPWFWLIITLIGIPNEFPNLAVLLHITTAFVVAAFLSILAHELGHAFVFRFVFHVPSLIVLHGFGGVTIPARQHLRKRGFWGTCCEVWLSFSGPLAGFVLAALFYFLVIPVAQPLLFRANADPLSAWLLLVIWDVVLVSLFWGIFNLLPIYPMDGGHISRELCCWLFPRRGIEFSLIISMVACVVCAVLSLRVGSLFLPLFFGFFAFQNYQELASRSYPFNRR